MSNEKKNTPLRGKKTAPPRARKVASPTARSKKSDEDSARSGPPREKRAPALPPRSRRSEGGDFSPRVKKADSPATRHRPDGDHGEKSVSPVREKRTASRDKRGEGHAESTASPVREKRTAPPARDRRGEGYSEGSALPGREKRTASPAARGKRTEEGSAKSADSIRARKEPYTRGKKTDAPAGEKNFQFPREARRYINVYLGLGSNVGDRRAKITSAINMISDQVGKIAKKSHLYETQPWGNPQQDSFLNQVIMINTMLDPRDLLQEIAYIEQELGRDRREKEKWGPRTIDIDILFYGKRIVRDKGLEVPHPELHLRAFVLVPLLEIAPDLEHPILKQQIDELYMACEDQSEVVMLDS